VQQSTSSSSRALTRARACSGVLRHQLAVNETLREALEEEDGRIALPHEILAGGGAGLCQVIATNPMEIGNHIALHRVREEEWAGQNAGQSESEAEAKD